MKENYAWHHLPWFDKCIFLIYCYIQKYDYIWLRHIKSKRLLMLMRRLEHPLQSSSQFQLYLIIFFFNFLIGFPGATMITVINSTKISIPSSALSQILVFNFSEVRMWMTYIIRHFLLYLFIAIMSSLHSPFVCSFWI